MSDSMDVTELAKAARKKLQAVSYQTNKCKAIVINEHKQLGRDLCSMCFWWKLQLGSWHMVTEIYMYVNWYIVCGYLNQSGF